MIHTRRTARRGQTALRNMVLVAVSAFAGFLCWYLILRTPKAGSGAGQDTIAPALPAPADPRLSYQGPFKNIRPDIPYVADDLCAKCHPKEAKTWIHHPMARTLTPIAQTEALPLDAKARNPFEALGQRFEVVRRDGKVWHRRSALDGQGKLLFEQELPVHFAIGSASHAHSYLSVRGSIVLQTPITWYAQNPSAKFWDLSPGFDANGLAGRRIGGDCLSCHSNGTNEDPNEETTYREPIFPNGYGIGCQRCHGPGGEHVKSYGIVKTPEGTLDPSIVNPAHLSGAVRESVCWQCHLEGAVRVLRRGRQRFDYRPGLPLDDFVAVFEDAGETSWDHVVNHVEQMQLSRCFLKTTEPKRMGCTTCHDPHEKPAPDRKVAHYRAACLTCHAEKSCSLPRPQRLLAHKDDSCVACHMPTFPASTVAHVSSTDHRIPRKAPPLKTQQQKGDVRDLVSFFEKHRVKNDPEIDRDRALAAAILLWKGRRLLHPLDEELEAAAQRDPGDLMTRAHYGIALLQKRDTVAALNIFQDILARQPDHEWALHGAAVAWAQLDRAEESLACWRRLIRVEPLHWAYRLGLIQVLMRERRLDEAEREARAWIASDPGMPAGRAMLRDCLSGLGKFPEAEEQQRIYNELVRLTGATR